MKQALRTWWVGIFLTLRSLTRGNIGTTVMTIFLMAMIFVNLIFLSSIINGLVETANRQVINGLTGEILVEAPSGETYISQAAEVEKQLRLVHNVQQVSPRVNFSAELEYNNEQGSYRGVAIHPSKESEVTVLAQNVVEGRFLRPDDTNAIVLGVQIAGGEGVMMEVYSLKGAQVGDTVTMRYTNGLEKKYEVVGIVNMNFVQADNQFFISQEEYYSLFPQLKDQVSEFAIKLTQGTSLQPVVDDMKNLDFSLNVRTWKDTAGLVKSFTSSFDIVNFIVSISAIIVAGITIFIIMYVDVVNRRRQIGILRAIGIAESSIAISYVLRALLYAFIGIVIGMYLFTFVVTPTFVRMPLQLPVGDVSVVIDNSIM
ncbi:MAG TPA: FtsX-like permease family protein, partial [Patescibacteria group bacterium]|nr:FtsX-like permease family protein [Patescibacteria group bacterium]